MQNNNVVVRVSRAVRYSPEWYEEVIPLTEQAVHEALNSERFYRMIGNLYQATLYADLAEQRLTFLNHLRRQSSESVNAAP